VTNLDDVLAIPDHLRDALWRVDSARLEAGDCAGLLVCGMGGSAIGGDLAVAAFGERLVRPMATVRGYALPSWAGDRWAVLCSSYSGETEETLACFEQAEGAGARIVVASIGGALVERARRAGTPVVGLPGILQPRAAVAYMLVVAAEVAAATGVGPSLRAEIEAAAGALEDRRDGLRSRAEELAGALEGTLPIVYGAELTAPVARRWKTQLNENAKAAAFFGALPEADHNEICGWRGVPAEARLTVLMLEDADQRDRLRRRFRLTAKEIEEAGHDVLVVESDAGSRLERMLELVMLGDLVSLRLAEARGVDPLAIEAIERLKDALGRP
jgi:glucose/mannose-6-phosphate isomerase